MIRDLASGPQAARLMATSFLVIGISPVLAPLLGSYLLHFVSWRGLFVLLALAGVGGARAGALGGTGVTAARETHSSRHTGAAGVWRAF